jgi:hypothetical protein
VALIHLQPSGLGVQNDLAPIQYQTPSLQSFPD